MGGSVLERLRVGLERFLAVYQVRRQLEGLTNE